MRFLTVAVAIAVTSSACVKSEAITAPFQDSFDRAQLGSDYHNTGGPYRIVDGQLEVRGAYNKPLWLRRTLPRNAVIELDVTSKSRDGDIKIELWGDGKSYAAHRGAYLATSYVFIFGGWHNSISALARLDEHGKDREERRDVKVVPNQRYHWKIKRQGTKIEWYIDGKLFLQMGDSAPLEGSGHAYLGFNDWRSDVYFDNLEIIPLN